MPTPSAALRMLPNLLRLRCPNCGKGAVLTRKGSVHQRCASCNFRYERSDENYWAGAMFFGYLFGAFTFAVTLLVVVVALWPNVPWDTMEWAIPLGMGVFLLFWIPISRVVWLTIDVMVRPVQPAELED
jgi:uncharacterized protein (DUF983 family)